MGNIAQSIGAMKGFLSNFQALQGGSNDGFRDLIHQARQTAYDRMHSEAVIRGGSGIVGTRMDFVKKPKHLEVVLRGTTVMAANGAYTRDGIPFSVGCSGNDLWCLIDSGFQPRSLVFGNEAYSRGLKGWLKSSIGMSITKGLVEGISDVFHAARHGALQRLQDAAFSDGCNFISGVHMKAFNYSFIQEVSFMGTACNHPNLPAAAGPEDVRTCTLSETEMWNLIDCGYVPLGVVTRTCVFSIGVIGSLFSWGQEIAGGEIERYTALVQDARQYTMQAVREDALELSPNAEVVGLDIEMVEIMEGLLEFNVLGTAVEKTGALSNASDMLPPQAMATPRPTFTRKHSFGSYGGGGGGSAPLMGLGGTGHGRAHDGHGGEAGKGEGGEGGDNADGKPADDVEADQDVSDEGWCWGNDDWD